MRLQLTDRFCARAPQRGVQTDYFDETCQGLALRVSAKRKSWTLHLTVNGRRQRLTLGTYPALSLAGARRKALEARTAVARGDAPTAPHTFKAICEAYLQRTTIRTKGWRELVLARLVYPVIGQQPIDELRRSEIVGLLDKIEDENGPAMADQTLAVIRRIMNWHASRSDDFRSPIVRGMARTKPHERAKERTLTENELRAIWRAAEGTFGRYVKFVLLTACRRSEAARAKRSEIIGTDWIIPGARYKTARDHLVPLSSAAIDLLTQGGDEYLFGARIVGSIDRHKDALAWASGTSGWTIHDLRRTARSLMSRAGVPSDHAERCLGHVIRGVRGTYDRHEYHEEKRQAFEALAALVARIVDPQPNVVAIR